MRQILAVVLTIVLSANLVAQSESPTDIRAEVTSASIGTGLLVTMKGGAVIRGRLTSVNQDGFTILTGRTKTTSRVINFHDADRVTTERRTHTPVIAWIAVGAILTIVVIVVAAFAIERHNEGG